MKKKKKIIASVVGGILIFASAISFMAGFKFKAANPRTLPTREAILTA